MAAKLLVKYAARAWRSKFPGSKIDDCAVVCLFLKNRTLLTRSFSEVSRVSINHTELAETYSEVSRVSVNHSEIAAVPQKSRLIQSGGKESLVAKVIVDSGEGSSFTAEVNRVDSFVKIPRGNVVTWRKPAKDFGVVEA